MSDVSWEAVLADLERWFAEQWVVDPQQRILWLGIIAMALRLEFHASFLLWMHEHPRADPNEGFDFSNLRLTLGQATQLIEEAGLLDARIVDILRAVWELRNSVAHKSAMFAVVLPRDDSTGVYRRSGHVFSDPKHYRQFLDEAREARDAIYAAPAIARHGQADGDDVYDVGRDTTANTLPNTSCLAGVGDRCPFTVTAATRIQCRLAL